MVAAAGLMSMKGNQVRGVTCLEQGLDYNQQLGGHLSSLCAPVHQSHEGGLLLGRPLYSPRRVSMHCISPHACVCVQK